MSSQETARQVVARTPAEWRGVWKDHSPADRPPVVDFATHMVVGVFLGTQTTAGYSVEIVGVKLEGDALVVEYATREPGRGSMTAQILTQPFHLVSVPKREGQVRFVQLKSQN